MSLFGGQSAGKAATGSNSLFGSLNLDTSVPFAADPASKRKSLFEPSSTTEARSSSMFGLGSGNAAASQPTPTPSFLNAAPAAAPKLGGIFGSTTANTGAGTNSLGLQVNPSTATKPSLFGAAPASTAAPATNLWGVSVAPTLGASNAQPQQQQQQPAIQQGGSQTQFRESAYFNGLLERQKKKVKFNPDPSGSDRLGQLPSMNMDLGDLARRAQELGSRSQRLGQSVARDSRAHYLLSGSGVTPGQAYRDLQKLDSDVAVSSATTTRTDFAEEGSAYLRGMQAKGREAMLRETMDRVYRDVDNYIEESLGIDFDEQKKRIMQHFGLMAAVDDGPTAPSSFGASKNKSGRRSVFGRSGLDKSLIENATSTSAAASFAGAGSIGTPQNVMQSQTMRDVRDKERNFMRKVENLNRKRLDQENYKILQEFKAVEESVPGDVPKQLVDAYSALGEMTKETASEAGISERSFVEAYSQNARPEVSIKLKRQLLNGSRTFLEKSFYRDLEDLVQKNPRTAQIGGMPTTVNKVRGYIRVRNERHDLAPDGTVLEQIGDQADFCWAIVFFLLRSGHVREAMEYVNSDPAFQSLDRKFIGYLNSFANSPDRILRGATYDKVSGEYQQRTRTAAKNSNDPYRIACLKIIGRCDLSQRNLESVCQGVEDWIWLQFALAREVEGLDDATGEVFGLDQIGETVREIGQKHFQKGLSEHANSYGTYFLMQVLAGMFEYAIDYLHSYNPVSAVHAAIALNYYGLLRVSNYETAGGELLTLTTTQQPQINLLPLIAHYTATFRVALPVQAVDYLTLICLNSDLPKPLGETLTSACHECLRELCLETREFAALLGDIRSDGSRIPGAIEKRAKLIHLESHEQFLRFITGQAAAVADSRGQTADAVLLYHLCDDYDNVTAVLNRALADAVTVELGDEPMLLQPLKPRAGGLGSDTASQASQVNSSLSLTQSTSSPLELARNMKQLYDSNAAYFSKISSANRKTCEILMIMLSARSKMEHPTHPEYLRALEELNSIPILPLGAYGDISTIRQMATQFTSLPQLVARCAGFVILWCVRAIGAEREKLAREGSWQAPGTSDDDPDTLKTQLNQMAKDLMVFAGLVRYKLPGRVYDLLTRAGGDVGGY